VGQGTTFEVRVPLGAGHLPDDRVSDVPAGGGSARSAEVTAAAHSFVAEAMRWLDPAPTPTDPVGTDDADRARVLVVDDNADMRQYVASLLETEYAVRTAADGLEALELVHDVRPDLVV